VIHLASWPGEPGPTDRLELADWRRRIAELYAEVRRRGADPVAAHALWRETREALYRGHPQSPVPPAARAGFRAVHFPYDPSLRFELPLLPDADEAPAVAAPLALPVSAGTPRTFTRIGWIQVPLPGGTRRLAVYWLAEYAGGLFLPFGDATNGRETYGAGRYVLDTAKGADLGGDAEQGTLVIDLNFAFQPSCAFDPRWACPLAPPENRLDVAVRAGERLA
jgi:uncharacterized protein (DUF1684 family)